ncbi:HARBI1 [Mytilus edulis]|uniref:Putative nuclease HARBI1 n=1 Tax=Mytilus edulis TaxID=6550 RepID=A0A8S3TFF0_MYTED|nr:HARBI1 [Mytilus edulis]
MAALLMVPRQRKERIFRGMVSHLNNLTDNEMRIRYRFGRDSIAYICNIVGDKLRRSTAKETALTVEQQVCIALRFYASGSFLQVIGDTMGYDKATVSRAVNDVTNALLDVKDNFIQWPKDINSKNRMKCGFHRQMNFPNVLGCIDCTHIKIQGPSEDEAAFVNRKGFHSVNVQAVCDYEGKFTNISANWPGSTHDSHIFNTSNLCHYLETNNRGLADGLILGDSGRQYCRWEYTSDTVFSIKFQVRMKPEKVCRVFGACAVLHNIALTRNEPLEDVCGVHVQQDQPVQVPNFEGEQDGRHIREHIARVFFN